MFVFTVMLQHREAPGKPIGNLEMGTREDFGRPPLHSILARRGGTERGWLPVDPFRASLSTDSPFQGTVRVQAPCQTLGQAS